MLSGTKLETLKRLNSLVEHAKLGTDDFNTKICDFLVEEYELQSSVLFKVLDKNTISVLGKSKEARKNFLVGTNFSIDLTSIFGENLNNFSINSEANNSLQISEYVIYESSILFSIENGETFILKIAKNSPFNQADNQSIENIVSLLGTIIKVWFDTKGIKLISEKPLSEIYFDTAHELRNPTNTIIGFTSILSADNLTSTQNEYTETIKKNAQNLLVTINDLIELSKIETGKITEEAEEINPSKFLAEIVDVFKEKINRDLVNIKLDLSNLSNGKIKVDAKKLKFILNNLLNYSKLSTLQGVISIKAYYKSNAIHFTLSDTGRGLTSDLLKKVFDPFELKRMDNLKESTLSGLVFPLVRKYVKLLGGNISVDSTIDKGTTFNFSISTELLNDSPESIKAKLSNIPEPTSDNNKILVIEDDYATSKLLSNYLNKWGYDPTIVNDEEQTFKVIEKENFLAVILDINIPNTNGLELLKKIHENEKTKNTPTIVCSVEPEEQKAYMMGAVEYFQKPINYNYLVEVLTSYKLRKNSNILCVDDDVPTLNLVKQAIETAGFKAVSEHISANVMDLISDKDIDLAIVDLDMPHPNGFELIKLIKSEKRFKNLPIIIYTGKENFQDDLKNIDGLFEELLSKKSTNIEDLAETINSMVNNKYETPATVEEVKEKDDEVKILLAEDYKHSQIIVTRLLKKSSFENVVVVDNGQQAVEMAEKEKFDLILMDMQMPIMNGFEAMENLRQTAEYKDTPIIALTAFAMKGDREKCLEAGATDYIPKPIDSKEFIEKVKYYTRVSE